MGNAEGCTKLPDCRILLVAAEHIDFGSDIDLGCQVERERASIFGEALDRKRVIAAESVPRRHVEVSLASANVEPLGEEPGLAGRIRPTGYSGDGG